MKSLLLIDASALIHRFYHALPEFENQKGERTESLYGLSNLLLKFFSEKKTDFWLAGLDRPEPTWRKKEFDTYKIQRPKTENRLIEQIKRMPEVFNAFGIKALSSPGFEADDIIGTVVEKLRRNPFRQAQGELEIKITILSGDHDMFQLVENDKIIVELPQSGINEIKTYNQEGILEKYGILPNQIPDFKGLKGDASDNIPGIDGIGEKAATDLLKEFKNIEGIYENLPIIKKKIAEKLENKYEDCLLYRRLATIRRDAPIEIPNIDDMQASKLNKKNLLTLFENLGFPSLIKKLENI